MAEKKCNVGEFAYQNIPELSVRAYFFLLMSEKLDILDVRNAQEAESILKNKMEEAYKFYRGE